MHDVLQDNWTPLHYAACSGHLATTETLLCFNADADAAEQVLTYPSPAAQASHCRINTPLPSRASFTCWFLYPSNHNPSFTKLFLACLKPTVHARHNT